MVAKTFFFKSRNFLVLYLDKSYFKLILYVVWGKLQGLVFPICLSRYSSIIYWKVIPFPVNSFHIFVKISWLCILVYFWTVFCSTSLFVFTILICWVCHCSLKETLKIKLESTLLFYDGFDIPDILCIYNSNNQFIF
jgi:hypothetical protein